MLFRSQKAALFWKARGMINGGCVLALTGKAADAVHMITSGITARRSAGSTIYLPFALSHLAIAHAELGQFGDAWRCIGEALTSIETAKEKWHEADANRIAGEIALKSPEPNAAEAEAYFELSGEFAQASRWLPLLRQLTSAYDMNAAFMSFQPRRIQSVVATVLV